MKFRLKDNYEGEEVIFSLEIEEDEDSQSVFLCANGEIILGIDSETGKIERCYGVSEHCGLTLDNQGRVALTK